MYPLNPAKADYSVNKVYRIHFSIVRRATGTGQSALWSQFAGRKRDGLAAPEPAHGFLAEVLALAAAARSLMTTAGAEGDSGPAGARVFTKEGVGGLIEVSDVEGYL